MLAWLDLPVLRWVYAGRFSPAVGSLVACISLLGSGWMLIPMAAVAVVRRWRRRVMWLLATLVTTSLVVAVVKLLVHRVRPCNALASFHAVATVAPSDYSFPSGHAAGSFAFAMFVAHEFRRGGAIAFPVAALVALTRVSLAVHYPTDVLAGALFGMLLGHAGWAVSRARGEP